MPGIFGGCATGADFAVALESSHPTRGNEDELTEVGPFGLGLRHHGASDPDGHAWWADGRRCGAMYGAAVNRDDLGWSVADLFERLLDDPDGTLAKLNGPFVVAAFDAAADRYVVGTDKLGTRTLYYRTDRGLRFGSELHTLVTGDDSVDARAVSDILLIGNVWGEKTLVEGVRTLPPGTYLEYEAGEAATVEYWRPRLDPARPGEQYLSELVDGYRTAMAESAATLPDSVGLFLSGGLDSRSMAAALHHNAERGAFDSLRAFTYASSRPGRGDSRLARRVADRIGVDVRELRLSPRSFMHRLDEAVSRTDGMANWIYLAGPATVFEIPEAHRCMMLEACGQGELFGEFPYRHHLTDCTVTEAFRKSDTTADPERVCEMLSGDGDPMETFRTLSRRSAESDRRRRILDIHYENYYARSHMVSTKLYRSLMGTRVPYAHDEFLDRATRLPLAYRMRTLPLSDGRAPYAVTRPKLELMRRLSPELSDVPYERTLVSPNRPYPAHVLGYGINKVRQKAGELVRSSPGVPGTWFRSDPEFRARIDELLEGAASREFFDAEAVHRLREGLRRDGEPEVWPIGAVTTVELWLRRHFDGATADETPARRISS